jgi:hypothetical protein
MNLENIKYENMIKKYPKNLKLDICHKVFTQRAMFRNWWFGLMGSTLFFLFWSHP